MVLNLRPRNGDNERQLYAIIGAGNTNDVTELVNLFVMIEPETNASCDNSRIRKRTARIVNHSQTTRIPILTELPSFLWSFARKLDRTCFYLHGVFVTIGSGFEVDHKLCFLTK